MTPEQESSYYEIALTNRQVLTIFVVLLTCLAAAFLSGVWIGRRDGAEGLLAAIDTPSPSEEAAAQLTELNFFSDAAPLKGREAPKRPAPPPERASEPPAEAPVETAPVPAPVPAAAKQPPEETAPPPAEPPPPPSPAATPAAEATGPVIQVFSTADALQARRLVQRLGAGGYPVFLLQESLQGQTMYRVRVGPYGEEDKAREVADELRREYRLDTWITSQPG